MSNKYSLGAISEIGSLIYAVVVPTYKSIQALTTNKGSDDKQWLSYWVIFGLLTFIEFSFNWLSAIIPFYHEAKSLILVWLVKHNGALTLYNLVISKFFLKAEQYVEDKEYRNTINEKIKVSATVGAEKLKNVATNIIQKSPSQEQQKSVTQETKTEAKEPTKQDNDDPIIVAVSK
ncbi:TB2/DP1 [Hexamita inflata]|uniref:HVA22 family protein n=1 Tax=Hexamita inflata TaxID=28002 RepID=A0AA86S2I0_9EUKA|nr:HVA22 family protein [Hexamita inflata]